MARQGRGSRVSATVKKERVKGKVTEPVGVTALRELVGVTKAAEFTGISTTQFHKARRGGQVSVVTEVAARGVLQEMGVPLADYGIEHVAAVPMERYVLKKPKATPAPIVKRGPTPRRPEQPDNIMFLDETANDKVMDAVVDKVLARLLKRA